MGLGSRGGAKGMLNPGKAHHWGLYMVEKLLQLFNLYSFHMISGWCGYHGEKQLGAL
jgi:hypothetical protein